MWCASSKRAHTHTHTLSLSLSVRFVMFGHVMLHARLMLLLPMLPGACHCEEADPECVQPATQQGTHQHGRLQGAC